MRRVHSGPLVGAAAAAALLAALTVSVGLAPQAWLVGLVATALGTAASHRAMTAHHRLRLGPADRVTATRAVLVVGVAALAADSRGGPAPAVLVVLAAVALALDALDGAVARWTRTQTPFGARADMEVDAFAVLVLSAYVASTTGWWVLAIGAARYLLWASALVWPWLDGVAPPRHWAKVVAAVQGVVLTVVASGILTPRAQVVVLCVALALLAESFGRQVRDLRRGSPSPRPAPEPAARGLRPGVTAR